MARVAVRLLTLAVAWVGLARGATAQRVTGAVEGWVTDSAGAGIASATIVALSRGGRTLGTATSDSRGHFRLGALPVGSCTILLRRVGYRPLRVERVPVRLGSTFGLGTIRLALGAVTLPALLVVSDALLLDPTTTAAGGNLPSDLFEALPIERNSHSLPVLLPQANQSHYGDEVNVAGSTGPENVYYVDGVNLTDPYRASTSGDLPYNFIKEVEVRTGGYEAEYGRALGGVVNVLTRSGDNDFRPELFGYFSGSALGGTWRRGLADARVQSSAEYDGGLAFSGPVVRDRLWFFTAYNRAVATRDILVPGLATQRDRRTSHLFAAKLDWVPGVRTGVTLTLLGDPSRQRRIAPAFTAYGSPTGLDNIEPFLGEVRQGGVAVSIRANHRPGPRVLIESAVSRFAREETSRGYTELARAQPLVQDLETGRWSGGFGDNSDHYSVRLAAKAAATWSPTAHVVKAGIEYEDNRVDASVHFTDPGILIRLNDSTYQAVYLITMGTVHNRVVSGFIQDSWLVTPHLRVNAGVRWDGQYLVGADGRRAQRIEDGVQPRLGLILRPGRTGAKIFGWFGRYYEQLPLFASATWWHAPLRNGVYFFDGDPRSGRAPRDSLDSGSHGILPEVPGLRGQHLDEVGVGFEQVLDGRLRLGLRGVHRRLREAIDDGLAPGTLERVIGNPGRSGLAFLERPRRSYYALELTVRWRSARTLDVAASYVLSRNRGNYTGLWDHDVDYALPNGKTDPDLAEQTPNSYGLLPNDRTHVFKLFGTGRLPFGLTVGAFFTWQTGTPLSELGATPLPAHFVNLRPRGTVGRTPPLRDLSLRLMYAILAGRGLEPRVSLDLLHVGSARRPVTLDQLHYAALDAGGRQAAPNPNYLEPTRYQPPMLVRLGATVRF